jgi:hypothetical protein
MQNQRYIQDETLGFVVPSLQHSYIFHLFLVRPYITHMVHVQVAWQSECRYLVATNTPSTSSLPTPYHPLPSPPAAHLRP